MGAGVGGGDSGLKPGEIVSDSHQIPMQMCRKGSKSRPSPAARREGVPAWWAQLWSPVPSGNNTAELCSSPDTSDRLEHSRTPPAWRPQVPTRTLILVSLEV